MVLLSSLPPYHFATDFLLLGFSFVFYFLAGIFWAQDLLTGKLSTLIGALSDLKQVLTNESPLKIMKNVFYFTVKSLFVIRIFKFLSWLFGHVEKRLDYKDKINFKVDSVTT